METVTVKDVTKNGQWYEISVDEYEEKISTKDRTLADAVNASVGNKVNVVINVRENGKFTNRYLQSVEPTNGTDTPSDTKVKNLVAAAAAPIATTTPEPIRTSAKADDRQRQIVAQWAFGRATELLAGSGEDYVLPLTEEIFANVKATAEALMVGAEELANR